MTNLLDTGSLWGFAEALTMLPDEVQSSLYRAAAWVRATADESVTVVDDGEHVRAFNARLAQRVSEPEVVYLFAAYVEDVSVRSRGEWIGMFRDVGFRGLCGDITLPDLQPSTVMDTVPDEPVALWRLSDDYSHGLSWAGDPRFARSRPWVDGRINAMKLWCAVVPPEALLGVYWYGGGVRSGRPLWRTVDSDVLGRVRLTSDDFSEWWVDPTKLDKVVVFDEFEREPVVASCQSYRDWPTGRLAGSLVRRDVGLTVAEILTGAARWRRSHLCPVKMGSPVCVRGFAAWVTLRD
ncbi:hypothetical protein [Gordonia terrae]|uniref:hypothetical protein n=1 Tax=Gordonia terrae TaxID=2055 RepID=UPI003F6CD64C